MNIHQSTLHINHSRQHNHKHQSTQPSTPFHITINTSHHTTHSTSASTVRASNPDLTQVSVRFRNAKDGGEPVAKKADGSAEQITGTVLYLELVPITYDLIAQEQVGYKHPTF